MRDNEKNASSSGVASAFVPATVAVLVISVFALYAISHVGIFVSVVVADEDEHRVAAPSCL